MVACLPITTRWVSGCFIATSSEAGRGIRPTEPCVRPLTLQGAWSRERMPNKRLKRAGGDRFKGSGVLCPGGHRPSPHHTAPRPPPPRPLTPTPPPHHPPPPTLPPPHPHPQPPPPAPPP